VSVQGLSLKKLGNHWPSRQRACCREVWESSLVLVFFGGGGGGIFVSLKNYQVLADLHVHSKKHVAFPAVGPFPDQHQRHW
jgi:hypothetical protein